MVSKFPRFFAAPDELASHGAVGPQVEGFGERVLDRVREAFCGLHGHDDLLQFGHDRMFLKCVSCGHESPGWELNEAPPTPAAKKETRRPALVGPNFVRARRIA